MLPISELLSIKPKGTKTKNGINDKNKIKQKCINKTCLLIAKSNNGFKYVNITIGVPKPVYI
jgi:hypothetical protein